MKFTYKSLILAIPDLVYPPAEDSFMLAEAAETLSGSVLEIGCGSGIVSLSCAKNNPVGSVIGVDINPESVKCSIENAKNNEINNAVFFESDLFGSAKLTGKKFDYILFNPPYLPTSDEEKLKGKINLAYDGGSDGRKVADRFLGQFEKYLKPKGALFLVQSSLNDLEKTKTVLHEKGFVVEIVKQENFFFEKLCLIKAYRKTNP